MIWKSLKVSHWRILDVLYEELFATLLMSIFAGTLQQSLDSNKALDGILASDESQKSVSMKNECLERFQIA